MVQTIDSDIATGIEHIVRMSKDAGRQLNEDKMRVQVDSMIASVNTVARQQRGWKSELRVKGFNRDWYDQRYSQDSAVTGGYVYHIAVRVSCNDTSRKTLDGEFQNIVNALDSRGANQPGNPWKVTEVDGKTYVPTAPQDAPQSVSQEIGYVPLVMPDNWEMYFEDMYGLEPQIRLMMDAIRNAIQTEFKSRVNTLLVGPPGCGKTNLCQILKGMFGDESVLEFDGTSTTMAGAQKELSEREELPRILLVEEIEKAPEGTLPWLLSILDIRGEIRKTTAVASRNILRETKMIGIVTVNDYDLFKRVNAGALSSRFANELFFNRPSRIILRRILEREIRTHSGNVAWIDPALDFAEEMCVSDPRKVISYMMLGRDRLLDGTYQNDVRATSNPTYLEEVADERLPALR